ncbi:MAG: ATP-binding cassette domain-containing protein [Flavobacteriales bacterium]|nr:ATP-binding cassette domain-containing protein [Flavobacteriales bacterium]MBK7941194.1 ATP-binding cassette domain-containing protein [Flavobacteriales bacterium]MBK9701222.1 ATP-binding cassette domain-containing protein [Flavobacteriales bacterium]
MSTVITPFQRLVRLLSMDRRELGYIYLYALVSGAINLTLPLGIQAIINLISGGQIATSWGVLIAFVTIGVAFAGVMQILQLTIGETIKQRLFARSAFDFAYRLPRLRSEAVQGRYLPELVNRFFDTLTIQKGLTKVLIDVPVASLQIVLSLVLLSFYHPFFIAFGLFLVALLYVIFRWTGMRGLRTSLEESKYKYEVAFWLEELGRNMNTFKLAGRTHLALDRTDQITSKYILARNGHFRVLLQQYGAMVLFKVIITLSLLILGGLLVMGEQMNLGQFVAAEIIILLVMAAVEKLTISIEAIYDVLTALEKIGNVTDLPLEQGGQVHIPASADGAAGMEVAFHGVTFRSPWTGQDVIGGVDLTIAAGQKICLSGPNGSGKTTLLQMIGGLVSPTSGTVVLDGHPLGSLDLDHARSMMGDSLNQDEVFSGTIQDNITMGRPWVTTEDVRIASERTGLAAQIARLPLGLMTPLDPNGTRLPRSLVKRVILARCLASRPKLLLIEDDLAMFDTADRDALLHELTTRGAPWTLVLVSNDPSVQARCERHVHLDDGRLHELGHA